MNEISVVIFDSSVIVNERQDKTLPLVELGDEIYSIRAFRRNSMDLTIREVHTYYSLVNSGEAEELMLPGVDNTPGGSFVLPKLDGEDKVYFYDSISKTKIYPGLDTIEKIKTCIAKKKNP